jgi:hypothetical protein
MKKKDLAVIVMSVIVAAIFSFIICNKFIGNGKDSQQRVEVVKPITAEFNLPNKDIFNSIAINPTKVIEIGPNTNNQPFANQ